MKVKEVYISNQI